MLLPLLISVLSASPAVGDAAPDFTATDTEGKTHTLSEMVKQGNVILVFFPKSSSGG